MYSARHLREPADMTIYWLSFLLIFPLSLAANVYDSKYKESYDTVLQKKCESLKLWLDAAFVGDRCFAVTKQSFNVSLDQWFPTLKSKCDHLYGYHAKVGNVYSEKQINVLLQHDVLQNNRKYFVGAKQSPTDTELGITDPEKHKDRWFYVGDDGKPTTLPVNPNLWIKGQPDNAGRMPPEYVLAIEKTPDTNKLGYNDINPLADNYQVLCEYEDFLSCPDNWFFVGEKCYRIYNTTTDQASAQQRCKSDGGSRGRLASIHNDRVNQLFADLARDSFNYVRLSDSDKDLSNNPVLFGLNYAAGAWSYDNGDQVDFFRWYDQAGNKIPPSNTFVVLNTMNNGVQGEAKYSYWTMANPNSQYGFICQTDPTIN